MNDHTQGGGVQDVIQIQFKVLLPSGCQGQGANKNQRGTVNPAVVVFQQREALFDALELSNATEFEKSEECI